MVPYLTKSNKTEENFDYPLCCTRMTIEQAIGILKRRFSCLHICYMYKCIEYQHAIYSEYFFQVQVPFIFYFGWYSILTFILFVFKGLRDQPEQACSFAMACVVFLNLSIERQYVVNTEVGMKGAQYGTISHRPFSQINKLVK